MRDNMIKRIIRTVAILTSIFSIFSCEVGLGEKVDVYPPSVKVSSPEHTGYILNEFTIRGTAHDDSGVSLMTVQIEPLDNPTPDNTYKFRLTDRTWEFYNNTLDSWEDYDTSRCTATGSGKDITWTLTYAFDNSVVNGTEFMIATQVYDMYGNESKSSKDERSVTVDKIDPVVSLIEPATVKNYSSAQALNNGYSLKDNTVLTSLINGEFTVTGSQKEEGKLDKLIVYLDDKTTSDVTDVAASPILKKTVTGDNLRNWSASFKLCNVAGYEHEKKIVRIVTESHDQAGNVETVCQGWFTYYNDADTPWVDAKFGETSYSVVEANHSSVYPGCTLQGQAYDDDGLKKIVIKVYKENETEPVNTETLDLQSENYPKYKAWSVDALTENVKFRVEVVCTDINGNNSEVEKRYMAVRDVNPPEIKITTDTTKPMFGNSSGDITLAGYVTDDGDIKELKLVRLSTAFDDPVKIIDYYKSTYSAWGVGSTDSAYNTGKVDVNGNKVWKIPLTAATSDDPKKVKKTFSKSFNIFNDFGIDGNTEKLKVQNFVIMAVDNGGSANIDMFTYAGDTESPKLFIKELVLTDKSGNVIKTIDFDDYNLNKKAKMLPPFNKDTNGNITDKIKIKGEWSDNSTEIWSNKKKHGQMTIDWAGATVTLNVKEDGTGKWETNNITPPDATTALIEMTFKDLAGNIVKTNENFFVSSNDPELLRITAEQNDGSYKAGEKIKIILEFNKAVKFSGGSPTLTLNVPSTGTKRTVGCTTSSQETNQHIFEYEVRSKEDIDVLDVTEVNKNSSVWKSTVNGADFEVVNMKTKDGAAIVNSLPATGKFSGSRTIKIDTEKPKITSLSRVTLSGSYGKDKEIFISAQFSESVTIGDEDKVFLNLNTGSKTTKFQKTGPNKGLFTYKVKAGENVDEFDVAASNGIVISGAGIVDDAGNAMDSPVTNTVTHEDLKDIRIDTTAPGKPTIVGISKGAYIYANTGAKFTLGNISDDAVIKKYSVDDGKSWSNYTGQVTIDKNGEYDILAYQEDAAGNKSPDFAASDKYHINIDIGNILTSITAGVPTGTYTTGKEIPVYLNFRKKVTIASGAKLTLSNNKEAVYTSGSGTTKATFTYTVANGDDCTSLNVSSITGTYKDEKGNVIDDYVKVIPTGKNLNDSRDITIATDSPYVVAATYNASAKVLTIEFNKPISKASGNIVITHDANYRAPSVLDVNKFNNYKAKESSIEDYYTLGVIGSDANENPDTVEKYILNFDKNNTSSDVISALQAADAHKVTIPINSSYITINKTSAGTDKNKKLIVTLQDSYALPVKGANYDIVIDAGIVKDMQNHDSITGTGYTLTENGVEDPVIRIEKKDEVISNISTANNTMTVEQPLTAQVKVDCQTPGVTPTVTVQSQTNAQDAYTTNSGAIKKKARSLSNATVTQTTSNGTVSMTLGSSTNTTNGYIYKLTATTTKNSVTKTAYEYAYRSVYTLTNAPGINDDVTAYSGTYKQLYIRGGDNTSGGLSISSFPVSWETSQFDKVRAMTNSTGSTWYWVTWKINVNAYMQPLRGNVPSEVATKGPGRWSWSMQGPVPTGLSNYILYPGQSLSISGNTNYLYGAMTFYKKHCEYRDGDAVIKEMQPE